MSFYYDTPSRPDSELPSKLSAREEDHSPTSPTQAHAHPFRAHVLMYSVGLSWLAAIVCWIFTLVDLMAIVFLSLAWTAISSLGARPEQPELNAWSTLWISCAALTLTWAALRITKAFRRAIEPTSTVGVTR